MWVYELDTASLLHRVLVQIISPAQHGTAYIRDILLHFFTMGETTMPEELYFVTEDRGIRSETVDF